MTGSRLSAAITACAIVLAAGVARGQPDGKRRVAVLEFRQGSSELPEIDQRLAGLLGQITSLDVVDASAARRRYGEHLDRDLVKCRGAAACVARIGARLEAVEVLLVGVSEFGDVILTLQRIRVNGGKVDTRIAEALEAGSPPESDVLRAYLERVMPKSDFLRYGTIRIAANEEGATVSIDRKPRGVTPVEPIKVPAPATYRIEVSKPGFMTFTATVKVPPDASVDVHTNLTSRTDDAWYKKWWVAAIAGTVVVGAATTAVILTRSDPTEVDVVLPPFAGVRF